MSYNKYICKSCEYKTDSFAKIKRHCLGKKSCIPLLNEYYKFSKDQCIILSFVAHNRDNTQPIDLNNLKKYNKIYENRELLESRLLDKDMKHNKCCSYCNETFNSCIDLKNHILLDCFQKQIDDLEPKQNISNKTIGDVISNTHSHNVNDAYNNTATDHSNLNNNCTVNDHSTATVNDNSTVNVDNTVNITLNIQTPVSFDSSWDISNIEEIEKKLSILCSDIIYTKFLSTLLENKKNLNVILDKSKDYGYVYKNDDEKYVQMKLNDIIDSSMMKMREKLKSINHEIKQTNTYHEVSLINEDKIRNKYKEYINKKPVKELVTNLLSNLYNDKKDESLEIFNNINENNDIELMKVKGY